MGAEDIRNNNQKGYTPVERHRSAAITCARHVTLPDKFRDVSGNLKIYCTERTLKGKLADKHEPGNVSIMRHIGQRDYGGLKNVCTEGKCIHNFITQQGSW